MGPDRLLRNEGGGKFRDVTAQAGSRIQGFPPALPGWTTTRMAWPTSSSPTTSSGHRRATCGAHSTAPRNPIALRNPTRHRLEAVPQPWWRKVRRRKQGRQECGTLRASRWAWRFSISM
jgi:hypothetical protein